MITERRMAIKRTVPFLLVGLSIFICYLYFFVDIPEMITTIQRINLFYYALAVVALLLDVFFYSLAWQYFLRPLSVNVSFRKTFLFVWVGTFVDLLVPAESVSGDFSKAYLMSRDLGGNTGKVVASIVSHRILSGIIYLSSLIIGFLSFLILKYELPGFVLNLIILMALGTAITLFFLFLLCLREQTTQKIIDSLLSFFAFILRRRWKLTSLRSKTRKALKAFHRAIEVLGGRPRSLAQPVIFSIASWLFSALISFLIFYSLGHSILLSTVIIVHSISCTVQAIPLGIPAEVGLTEILMTSLYALLGVPLSISAAATILIRIITVWFKFLIGFVAIQWIGIKALIGSSH